MDSFESRMNPRFLAESEKGMLWEPRVIESGRGTVEGFKEDEKEKRRASVLSSFSLSWFSVITQDNVGTAAVYRTMWEQQQFTGQCGNSSSLQDNVGTVYRTMWEQQQFTGQRGNSFIGQCGNSSSLQDNVGTVYRTMWEQQQFIGQCGNGSSL